MKTPPFFSFFMRTGLLLSALLLVVCGKSYAQVGESRRNIAVGFSGGLSMNKIGFDPTVKQSFMLGPTIGVVGRFTSEKYFSALCALQIELNYTRLGWKENILNSQSEPLPDRYQREQHYLQMPVMARLAWGRENRGVMGYFIAGPQIGYCFRETTSQSDFTLNSEGVPDRPNDMYAQYDKPIERKFDYGITGGLGMELNTKLGHFLVEGRYYYGLSDIFNNSKKDVFGRSNNGTILVKMSYLIDVRK